MGFRITPNDDIIGRSDVLQHNLSDTNNESPAVVLTTVGLAQATHNQITDR